MERGGWQANILMAGQKGGVHGLVRSTDSVGYLERNKDQRNLKVQEAPELKEKCNVIPQKP
jgi:hypothetical protein